MISTVESLAREIVKRKKLEFRVDEISVDECLIEQSIVSIENEFVQICDYKAVANAIIEVYSEQLAFAITNDFGLTINFIESIKDDFRQNGYVKNSSLLFKAIWQIAVYNSNQNFNCDFDSYLESPDNHKTSSAIFEFLDAYSELLPKMSLTVDSIFKNAVNQIKITESDATYNIPRSNLMDGIAKKCKSDSISGMCLFEKILSSAVMYDDLLSAVVTGLYESTGEEFFELHLKVKINNSPFRNPILLGLSNVSELDEADCKLFLQIVNNLKDETQSIPLLISVLISILRSDCLSQHNSCFIFLDIFIENEETAPYLINSLSRVDDYQLEKTNLIKKLAQQEYFSIDKHKNIISNALFHIDSSKYFEEIVLHLISMYPFKKFADAFSSYIHSTDKKILDEFILRLLTDNKAQNRYIGTDLYEQLAGRNHYTFVYDITSLTPILQFKTIISLTIDIHEPKRRIGSILPFVDSKSEFIREALKFKLMEISEDYPHEIARILDENLDKAKHDSFILDINEYIKEYTSMYIEPKFDINEFNPYYTDSVDILLFNEMFDKKIRQSVNESSEKNSFLQSIATTINLSKGGGWMSGRNKEISKLGKIEASFALPRSYFINPDRFEMDLSILLKKDWIEEDFEDVKEYLNHE